MEEIWFGIETKVRALIKDVLEPTVRRVIENRESLDKVSKTQEIIYTRIDDLDSNISKYARKMLTIDELSKKILEYDAMIRIMEGRFNRDREEIKAEVSTFTSKITNFEEYLSVFDHLKDALRSDITNLSYSLNTSRSQTDEKFDYFKGQYHDKITSVENQIMRHEAHLAQFEKDLKSLAREVGDNSTIVLSNERSIEELTRKAKEMRNSYTHLKKNTYDSIEKLRLLAIKTMNDAQVADRKILELINSEIPIRSRLMISDTLFTILSDPFQKHDLAHLAKTELDQVTDPNINPELLHLILNSKAKAEQILLMPLPEKSNQLSDQFSEPQNLRKKNKKRTIFVVKKDSEDETPQRGPRKTTQNLRPPMKEIQEEDSSPVNSDKNPTFSIPNDAPITANINRQIRRSELINLRDYEVIKDELQIARYNSLIGKAGVEIEEQDAEDSSFNSSYGPQTNYHPFIEEAKAEALAIIEEVKSNQMQENFKIHSKITSVQEAVATNHQLALEAVEKSSVNSKKNLKELELIINQALAECTSAITSRKRDQSDFNMEVKTLVQRVEQVESKFVKVQNRVEEVYKNFDSLVECLRILNAICKQDEVDRESIALMGYKENKGKGLSKPIVTIDKQCLSCTGQASVVITAFKIACLAYTPSTVVYKEQNFSRKELLNAQETIIKSLELEKTIQVNLILDDIKNDRCRTTSNIRVRPLSVPSTFTLQTPRMEVSTESEFPKLSRRNRMFLNTPLQ